MRKIPASQGVERAKYNRVGSVILLTKVIIVSAKNNTSIDGLTFDPRTEMYEQSYDTATGSEIVIDAIMSVAEVADISAVEMEPLGESVDIDALAKIIETTAANDDSSTIVTVRIHEHDVTIGGGRIVIDPRTGVHR